MIYSMHAASDHGNKSVAFLKGLIVFAPLRILEVVCSFNPISCIQIFVKLDQRFVENQREMQVIWNIFGSLAWVQCVEIKPGL